MSDKLFERIWVWIDLQSSAPASPYPRRIRRKIDQLERACADLQRRVREQRNGYIA